VLLTLRAARLAGALAILATGSVLAQTAVCYNCPPEWADWGTQLRKIKEKTGITVPQDNKNSGQTLAQLVAEKASPVADVAYFGVTFGIQAKKEGVVAPYKPAHFDEIPAGLKDPDGNVFHTYSAYARGIDLVNTAYNYLDLVPKGRDENGSPLNWIRHHDKYKD